MKAFMKKALIVKISHGCMYENIAGEMPYAGMTEDDIKTFIKGGQTLGKPEKCPQAQ